MVYLLTRKKTQILWKVDTRTTSVLSQCIERIFICKGQTCAISRLYLCELNGFCFYQFSWKSCWSSFANSKTKWPHYSHSLKVQQVYEHIIACMKCYHRSSPDKVCMPHVQQNKLHQLCVTLSTSIEKRVFELTELIIIVQFDSMRVIF